MFLFVKGLPHCLSVRSLLCTNAICLDGSKEQWSGFRVSVSVGVFNPHIMEIICYFHKVIQEMRDGSNLGISNVHPAVYSRIAVCLGYISQTYRLVAHAKKAMAPQNSSHKRRVKSRNLHITTSTCLLFRGLAVVKLRRNPALSEFFR